MAQTYSTNFKYWFKMVQTLSIIIIHWETLGYIGIIGKHLQNRSKLFNQSISSISSNIGKHLQNGSNNFKHRFKTQDIEIEIPAEQSKKTGKLQNTSEPFGTIQYYPKILQLCSWVVYVGNLANSHREEEPWKEIRCHRIAANDHRRRPTQKEPTASMASQEFHL